MHRWCAAVLTGAFALGALGCNGGDSGKVSAAASPDSVSRTAASPTAASSTAAVPAPAVAYPQPAAPAESPFLLASGPVTEEQQLDVVALRAGQLTAVEADVTTHVRRGQELARQENRQLLADRSAAAYKLLSLRDAVKNREAEVKMREADLRRAEEMHQAGINTQEDYEHIRFLLDATQLQLESQQQDVLAANANVEALDAQLAQTHLAAPFDGVVSQRYVRVGQYLAVGDKLFHLMGNSPLEVRFTLPGAEVRFAHRGEVIAVSASPDFAAAATARITTVSPAIDPGSGMVEIIAVLSHAAPGIQPGMIVSVRLPRSRSRESS